MLGSTGLVPDLLFASPITAEGNVEDLTVLLAEPSVKTFVILPSDGH